ncbi:hypothetical protein N9N03_00325 [Chlamydiia bacterium]|nr:hypothetical protein [Chlamydiia bacterium]
MIVSATLLDSVITWRNETASLEKTGLGYRQCITEAALLPIFLVSRIELVVSTAILMLSTIPAFIFNERYNRLIYQVEDSFYAALLSKRYLYQNMFALHNNNAYLRLFTVQEYCRNHFGGTERLQIDIYIRAFGSTLLEVSFMRLY